MRGGYRRRTMANKQAVKFYTRVRGQDDRPIKSKSAVVTWRGPGWAAVRQWNVTFKDGTQEVVHAKNIIWTKDGENFWYLGTAFPPDFT